ncbi:MAG: hydrogenase maturation nickel metallochaperone HypA [Magnetococcales bacterium]|nr:hydrogenase maturation nickel metallochaperone HypA [Magnetococcales bacterium]
MHELSIAMALIDQVQRIARRESAARVVTVRIRVGCLSGVDAEALGFCFPLAARGSLAESARLEIDAEPMQWYCIGCRRLFSGPLLAGGGCPACGSPDHHPAGGSDLTLESLEVA